MISKEGFLSVVFFVWFRHCAGQNALSFDWCDPSLNCGALKNSMCYMTKKENTNDCFFIESVMTAEDKRVLLAMHNTVRDQLAGGAFSGWPSASDMRLMSWDDTLATQATLWAYQCNDSSDPCPRHPYFPRPGQAAVEVGDTQDYPNVVTIFKKLVRSGREGTKSVDKWPTPPVKDATPGYTSFHQVIYARQTTVGCGIVRYLKTKKGSGGKKMAVFTLSLWCNYGTALQPGEKVYTSGDPCASCPDKTKCKADATYPHLCAKSDDPMYSTFIDVTPRSNGQIIIPEMFTLLSFLYWNAIR